MDLTLVVVSVSVWISHMFHSANLVIHDHKQLQYICISRSALSSSAPFYMVPTVDTVRSNFPVKALVLAQYPVLLTGPVATGKTSVIHNILQGLDKKCQHVFTVWCLALSVCVYAKSESFFFYSCKNNSFA